MSSEAERGPSSRWRILCAPGFRICRWDELEWVPLRINHPLGRWGLGTGDRKKTSARNSKHLSRRRKGSGSKKRPGITPVEKLLPRFSLGLSLNHLPPITPTQRHPPPASLSLKTTPSSSVRWGRTGSWGNRKG